MNSSKDAGVDLEKFPDKMLDPAISARILVLGILDGRWNGKGKGLGSYLTEKKTDYRNARRTVNITDKWQLIKGYSLKFEAAIKAARDTSPREIPPPAQRIAPRPLFSVIAWQDRSAEPSTASLKADLATQTRMKTVIRLLEHRQRPSRHIFRTH